MLTAKRKLTGSVVLADSEEKSAGPFLCPNCGSEVVLRSGTVRLSHFAHKAPITCAYGRGESEEHRRCKLEIYQALLREPSASDVVLERSLGAARADIFARIRGVPVAIEVQLSVLSVETIARRTEEYARQGIYVLWLPQWSPRLDARRYNPRVWEKWLHSVQFGHIYYWRHGLAVASYRFESSMIHVPKQLVRNSNGKRISVGGYARRSKRFRSARHVGQHNIVRDFAPKNRLPWSAGKIVIPSAKLFIE
jgi:competence protein CoiA